jgi:phosphoglycolate phosphatase
MAYRHIIWDYNGTLLNDVDLSVSVMNAMLSERNLPKITTKKYKKIFDFPVVDYYAELGFDFASEPFDVVGLEFIRNYDNRRNELKLQNSALEILDFFQKQNIIQSILSARNQKQLEEELLHFEIEKYFSHVSGLSDDYAGGKTENGKILLEKIGIEKSKTVLIGDTLHDFETAQIIGTDCILIADGHNNYKKLQKTGTSVLRKLEDLKLSSHSNWFHS